jgi:apolipoprotein N-acyltransferase
VFPYPVVAAAFHDIYGPTALKLLPTPQEPLATPVKTPEGDVWMVNNAFWSQALANIFHAEVVVGLEDVEEMAEGHREYYSAAMHFSPHPQQFAVNRYEKRVLVPMGEYIPFTFCKKLAEAYGICGSFTPGTEAKVFGNKKLLGLSICYEETFGHLMRESKMKGAEILVNLTSDVWYPRSRLMQQHFDHSRLRTVENGVPLLRACNTGITCAIDSLGRPVKTLGESPEKAEWLSDSLRVDVPTYTYPTLYSRLGDHLILCLSLVFILCGLRYRE